MTEDTYQLPQYPSRFGPRQTVWQSLIGHTVAINWRHIDPRDEPWERYQVVDADGEWVKLQGVDQPKDQGDPGIYQGGPFVVRLSDIEMAEVIE